MKVFQPELKWLADVFPEGIAVPSSTLISGPGGSGKPLIGLGVAAEWIRKGGSVVFIPLQYPGRGVVEEDMREAYGIRLSEFEASTAFVYFDRTMDPYKKRIMLLKDGEIASNLANPDNFSRAIDLAALSLPNEGPGTLIFATAVNLLLFSESFAEAMHALLQRQLREDKRYSWLYTATTSTLVEKIASLEEAAENLLISERPEPEGRPLLRAVRARHVRWREEAVELPLDFRMLQRMRQRAKESREVNIPALREI